MNIYEYLCREARRITSSSLADLKSPGYWRESLKERRSRFAYMLGIDSRLAEQREPPKTRYVGSLERDGYTIRKLYFESLPRLYVTGNLYLPREKGRKPAVLYLCGHAQNQKHHYQAHAHKLAQMGFVTLVIETIQLGEIPGYHHGTYRYGLFNWYSLGYTPAGVEVWNAVRAIDLLQSLPDVDPGRIGVTGISGGGAMTWFTAAIDDRVKAAAPVCGTATIESHICRHTLEGHCDCMFWINVYRWDLADIGALIAPRPLLIASAQRDWIFDIESVRHIYGRLKKLYSLLGAPGNVALVETPGGHSYHEKSRKAIFKWFLKHLKGVEATWDVGDIDERPESLVPLEDLSVFRGSIPPDEKVTCVHDWFMEPAKPPRIENREELESYRRRLIETLTKDTFASFPRNPPSLNMKVELTQEAGERLGYLITYTSEEGWRLRIHVSRPKDVGGRLPILAYIARNARNLYFGDELLKGLPGNWASAIVEVRGVGETSWGQDLQWFIRRAAMLTGRTIASMRIYDALRALEALSTLEWVDRERMAVMGSGEMAVVALYAALLRGDLSAVILHDPPPTHNMPSNPDGSGPAIELLNILRHTDLPYAAGLLWPAELVFLGPRPPSYAWAEELYVRLGAPGAVKRLKNLSQWRLTGG